MTTKSHEKEYETRLDELRAELESKQAEIDSLAYRCGLMDYVDNIEIDYDPKYCELLGELHDIEDEIEDVQSEIDDIAE